MAVATRDLTFPIFKFLCREGSNGLNIYSIVENLSHSSNDLHLNLSYVRRVINNSEYFHQEDDTIYPKTSVRICGHPETHDNNCTFLHLCKFYVLSNTCTYSKKCIYGHNVESQHNTRILKEHGLHNLSFDEVRGLLQARCNRTSETKPLLCIYYNNEGCRKAMNCHCIHICKKFLDSKCQGKICNKNHYIDEQVMTVLEKFGFDTSLDERSVIDLIKTVTELKFEEVQTPSSAPSKSRHKHKSLEFCRFFLKGECLRRNCKFIHSKLPYMWLYYENQWLNFSEEANEQLEKQYADPNLKNATLFPQFKDISKVDFVTMMASKLDGNFLKIDRIQVSHNMNWVWYWRAKPETWIEMSKSGIEEENEIIEKHFNSLKNLKLHFKESNTYAVLNFENMELIHKSIRYPVSRRPKEKE